MDGQHFEEKQDKRYKMYSKCDGKSLNQTNWLW